VQSTCINLLERFGKDYRVTLDPAARTKAQKRDPWMMTIPCRGGVTIYPYGHDRLAVEVDGHPKLAKRLADIPGVTLYQDGDQEATLLFDVALFAQVAALVKPCRRRRLSPDAGRRFQLAGQATRFTAAVTA
jgi:hypothetical protein